MAKKGGNKKKGNARRNQKKVATTTATTPEESLPVTPVNALNDDKADVLTGSIVQGVAREQQIDESKKKEEEEEEEEEEVQTADRPSILSNASEETSENLVESLDVKESLEEPPHVEVKAEPVTVVLDALPEIEQPVAITLEKSIIPNEPQQTVDVEPVPEEISPVLPKVETEDVPLLQKKKQDQEPIILVVSESEASTSSAEEEEQQSVAKQDQLTLDNAAEKQQIISNEQDVAKANDSLLSANPEIQESKVVQQFQEPKQVIPHENEQNEANNLVAQTTANEAKNVQESHVSEPITFTEATEEAHDSNIHQKESNDGQNAYVTDIKSKQQAAPIPPVVIVDDVDQDIPAHTEKEVAPPPACATSLEKEDTTTVGSQSVLTSTNTEATINEEVTATPKKSLKKSRSILGSKNKDKSVTKRKSQILSLFKRGSGGDKTSSPPPVPELPATIAATQTEKKQQQTTAPAKKLNKRKSWMFWKSSTAVVGQQKN